MKLTGKAAFVSGSGRGIGKAIALKLASEGAAVVVNDIDPASGSGTVEQIARSGGRAIAVIGDVTEASFPERFVEGGLREFGSIDIIVNNAGYAWDRTIANTTDESFEAMLDIHRRHSGFFGRRPHISGLPQKLMRRQTARSFARSLTSHRSRPSTAIRARSGTRPAKRRSSASQGRLRRNGVDTRST
jgi:3-oxoacyl-[acyl-carrier protein] reductase